MFRRGVIYLDENECPKCRGKLVLVTIERSVTPINKNGSPIITQDIDDEIEACLTCKKCGETYDVEKRGMYYQIKKELPVLNIPSLEEFNPFSI